MKLHIDGKVVKVRRAEGTRGFLLRSFAETRPQRYWFRVYRKGKGKFTDYDISHSDLEVRIVKRAGACFYDNGERRWLDHDPDTLGLTPESQRSMKFVTRLVTYRNGKIVRTERVRRKGKKR